ncbi:MAG TPA: tetratricopeptide repeat protein [Planctomycetota bacterium]
MKKALAAAVVALAVLAILFWPRRDAPLDFERDVAPIVRSRCGSCHRPEGGAPFALLDYDEVKARAAQIADATGRRIMPPWMPEKGEHAFAGDRSLTEADIATLGRWAAEGAPGKADRHRFQWIPTNSLLREDLVVRMPEPYALPASGPDVYRNFVVPLPLDAPRAVRAWQFRPGSGSAIHHAFVLLDATGESARLDAKDPEPGFYGLHTPRGVQAPPGHFMSWQPGADARRSDDFPWTLPPGALVLQAHLRPTGKPEQIQPSVAFSFAERASERQPTKIALWSQEIDIPAGATAHAVKDAFTLPVDVDVLGLLPHAHYLATTFEAKAARPDGTSTTLLRIPRWNFDWQGDYAYRTPVFLPKGTVVSMEVVYDNSAGNPRNPNVPPKRVRYGVESSDEMAELMLRVLPRDPGGAAKIEEASAPRVLASGVTYNRYLLEKDPENGRAHAELGKSLVIQGKTDEAGPHLAAAIRLRPDDDEPHYFLGIARRMRRQPAEALACFQAAVRLNPKNAKAHGNLGLVLLERGDLDGATRALETALRLNPADEIARQTLADIAAARKR